MAKFEFKTITEWIGIVAVVGSLLLVAIQVNQNSVLLEENVRLARAQSKQMSASIFIGFNDIVLSNPDARNALFKSYEINSLDELTEDELRLFMQLMARTVMHFSDDHYRHTLGVLEQSEWEESLALLRSAYISNRAFQLWWELLGKSFFGPRTVNFVNAEIENAADI